MMIPLFLLVFVILRVIYWFVVDTKHPKGFPNGPKFSLPLIGNAFQLARKDAFEKLRKEYGDAVGIWLGQHRTVLVYGIDLIQEVGANPSCQDRFKLKGNFERGSFVMGDSMPGVLISEGKNWQEQRRFTLHSLRNFGFGKKGMEEIITEEVRELLSFFDTKLDQPLDVKADLTVSVLNTLWKIVTSQRFSRTDKKLWEFYKVLDKMTKEAFNPFFQIFHEYNFLMWVNKHLKISSIIEGLDGMLEFAKGPIKEHRRTYDQNHIRDFIDAYLQEIDLKQYDPSSSFYGQTGEQNFHATIADLYLGGSETTSNTLYWALLFMVHHPDIQEKVCQELDRVTSKSRLPNMRDQDCTPYTNAVIHEVQRMGNVVAMSVPHANHNHDVVLGNGKYFLPKGTLIMPVMASVLSNPEQFPDPEKFDPLRFIKRDGTFEPHPHVIPFGVGRRRCLGESLAKPSLYLFFTAIVSTFKILPKDATDLPPTDPIIGVTSTPHNFEVIFKHRA